MKKRLVKKTVMSVINAIEKEKRITGAYADTIYGRLCALEDNEYHPAFCDRARFNKHRHYFLSCPAVDLWTDEDVEDYSVWVNRESDRLSRKAETLAREKYADYE